MKKPVEVCEIRPMKNEGSGVALHVRQSNMMMAIYCRVSKDEQNPENQEIQLKAYADRQGWDYKVFLEKESTRNTRPIKQQLMQDLRHRKFDGVLIWKLDRWARSLRELITDIDELISKKLEFIVMTTPIDTTTAAGRFFIQILGAFAEFEREINRERTMAGLARARAKGVKLGRPKKKKVIKQGGFTYDIRSDQ